MFVVVYQPRRQVWPGRLGPLPEGCLRPPKYKATLSTACLFKGFYKRHVSTAIAIVSNACYQETLTVPATLYSVGAGGISCMTLDDNRPLRFYAFFCGQSAQERSLWAWSFQSSCSLSPFQINRSACKCS
ncbi:hypothetical protein CC2G_009465 [Coprinopsis cinerea AmutBmut pab1-1]|nr:hypothetical protein CC2G_009465 [Coprinopsis cinerea AmutBmut pab1-1]